MRPRGLALTAAAVIVAIVIVTAGTAVAIATVRVAARVIVAIAVASRNNVRTGLRRKLAATAVSSARIASLANKVLKVVATKLVVDNISSVSNSLSARPQLPLQLRLKVQLRQRLERLKVVTLSARASVAIEANAVSAAVVVVVAVVVGVAVAAVTMATAAVRAAKTRVKAAVPAPADPAPMAALQIKLRPHLASRAQVVVISAAAHRAGPSLSPAPKRRVNKLLANMLHVSMLLVNIPASRPRLPRRSLVSPTLRRRPARAAPTNSRCGVRHHRAAAARGVARARVATSNRISFG